MYKLFFVGVTLFFAGYDLRGGELAVPFDVPPHGKPGQLLGENKLEAPTAMAFDSKNQPYLINNRNPKSFGKLQTVRNGKWITRSFLDIFDKDTLPTKRSHHANGELVIDDQDCLYATVRGKLIYSPDLGKTYKAYPCEGSLEVRTSSGRFPLPPVISQLTNIQKVEGMHWGGRSPLVVLLLEKTKDDLVLGEPIKIADDCMAIGSGGHSGGTSFAVTTGYLTHIVYSLLPKDTKRGGNPIHIATIDRKTRTVVAREFLLTAEPKQPDVHTRPTITKDRKGYLHVLSGSHGTPFYYMRSLKPADITSGWTKPIKLTGRQCYASIVCDQQDRLHSVFREWAPHATLGYSSATAESGRWSKSTTLVHGANPKGKYRYGIFYHRLFMDRTSKLYLSFTFWEQQTKAIGDYPEVLTVSEDSGRSWRLVSEKTFSTGSPKTTIGE